MKVIVLGIDLAKQVFALHGVDEHGKAVLIQPAVRRDKLLGVVAALPPCLIGMEACSGAHHWARQFVRFGHTVRLMAPKFVSPYRLSGRRGKNDAADAAAICEAVQRPQMRFVPIKDEAQQAHLTVHRVREGFVAERTATINRLRGLLSEFGVVLPLKASVVRRQARAAIEALPVIAREVLADLLEAIAALDTRITAYDAKLRAFARQDGRITRLMQLPGLGEITAGALVASVGNGHDFRNGRQFAAWLGLTPGQYSSGGKPRLGRITKAGDRYLRSLLVMGARAVLALAARRTDRVSRWAHALALRRGYWRAVVAIAAKNARLAWACLARGEAFVLSGFADSPP
ncbi:IS110 family transposase [Niveibacterium sp. SC-1]|uniref:IS110 family transposase n=1 Tax=Niveibacterium sp. SC-1 TaxID=3135646 RepID=UPI00311EE7C9